jgi:biopolymer transport protein ExbD
MPSRRWVGYPLLVIGLLLLFDTETFTRTNWSPLHVPMSVPAELAWAYLLVASGIVTLLAPTLIRMVSSFAPDDSVRVGQAFPHQSVELRRKRRLPLRRQFSALPNRALVGGATMLLLLIPAFLMAVQQFPPARGIYVRLFPRNHWEPNANCPEGPIVVRVEWQDESSQMVLNGKQVRPAELERALKTELARRPNREVFVEGENSVPYADVMYVVDVASALYANAVILTPKLKEQIADECSPR